MIDNLLLVGYMNIYAWVILTVFAAAGLVIAYDVAKNRPGGYEIQHVFVITGIIILLLLSWLS